MKAWLVPAAVAGVLASVIVVVSDYFGIPGWAAFLAWTAQGLLDGDDFRPLASFAAFAVGLTVAIACVVAAEYLAPFTSGHGAAVSVGFACGVLALLPTFCGSRFAAAAVFFGMIAWFASRWPLDAPSPWALLAANALGHGVHMIAVRCGRTKTARPIGIPSGA